MAEFALETERLILREWRKSDAEPFHAMCQDPQVMATLGPIMTRAQSDATIDRMQKRQADHGHCFWAMERKDDQAFMGWCGIVVALPELPIGGNLEIGWRLAHAAWGRGYAREGAEAALAWAFNTRMAPDVWAITSRNNSRSWGLMERLGMERQWDMDFDHPNVADDSPLKQHITYRIRRPIM
jgi:RimJ/RimL family protein N-acetyltransferase